MWVDKILYWSWPTLDTPNCEPPTKKYVEYAKVVGPGKYLNGDKEGEVSVHCLAIGVWDDDKYTPLNRGHKYCELEWYRKYGAEIVML